MTQSQQDVIRKALDSLVDSAKLLGTTQAAKLSGTYSQTDSIFERTCYENIESKKQMILYITAQPVYPASNDFNVALKKHETNCCMFERGVQTLDDLYRSREMLMKSVQPCEELV